MCLLNRHKERQADNPICLSLSLSFLQIHETEQVRCRLIYEVKVMNSRKIINFILLITIPVFLFGCSVGNASEIDEKLVEEHDTRSGGDSGMEKDSQKKIVEKKMDAKKPKLIDFKKGIQDPSDNSKRIYFRPDLQLEKSDSKLLINFTLENISGKPQDLVFSSGQEYDYFIYNQENELIYQWSDGKMFTMAIKEVTLDPGDRLNYSSEWDFTDKNGNKVQDGEFRVEFKVTAKVESSSGEMISLNELYDVTSINTVD